VRVLRPGVPELPRSGTSVDRKPLDVDARDGRRGREERRRRRGFLDDERVVEVEEDRVYDRQAGKFAGVLVGLPDS
jgi:hypothetical protein